MRPDKAKRTLSAAKILCAGLAAWVGVVGAHAAQAQSAYACSNLETHAALPAVEGRDGFFFAIHPEMQSHHGLADETIAHLSDLNAALASRGTVLVYLPVPTKAQVMSDKLPPMAGYLGFDAANAIAVHRDMILRLQKAGVIVADAMQGLRTAARAGERPYFETDPRPTTIGSKVLAAAVDVALTDHPALAEVERYTFASAAGDQATVPSAMQRRLQTACRTQLPMASLQRYETNRISARPTAQAAATVPQMVVLGTAITGTPELNLPGFLSEATGIAALGYGVAEGGAFAAMSSYLTSADFQINPPRVLVWEVPVSASLAAHGDQPIRELVAAAANTCQKELTLNLAPGSNVLRADLGQLPGAGQTVLALDTGGAAVPHVRFHFTGSDGMVRTRSIYRHADQLLTGRFYLPLAGLNVPNLRSVQIEAPAAFGATPRLVVCS